MFSAQTKVILTVVAICVTAPRKSDAGHVRVLFLIPSKKQRPFKRLDLPKAKSGWFFTAHL